jgi:predicted Zn finger-like uncharacterized protein
VQTNCPQCSQRIVIDDAKVPERAFKVKCPKCGNSVSFPGKGAGMSPAGSPNQGFAPPAPPAPPPEEMRSQLMAELRREMSMGAAQSGGGRALVSLSDSGVAGAITVTLTRLGHQVDNVEDPEEGARLLEQGVYGLVVTSRAGVASARGENLFQRISRLSPENRRRIFLVLVGDEYKTGEGLQAWTTASDLVLNGRDAGTADAVIRGTQSERQRLYQAFLDARRRFEEAS